MRQSPCGPAGFYVACNDMFVRALIEEVVLLVSAFCATHALVAYFEMLR